MLSDWVRAGGVLITTKSASHWAQDQIMRKSAFVEHKKDENTKAQEEVERLNYDQKTLRDAEHLIGGAMFGSDLDFTHPLGFGFADKDIATMRASTAKLKRPKDPYAVVAQYKSAPLLVRLCVRAPSGRIGQFTEPDCCPHGARECHPVCR